MRLKIFFVLTMAMVNMAQASAESGAEQKLQAPLFDNLGNFHHEISTNNPLAQRFFDQGLVLFYGFEWSESIRSFKEAVRLDANCGMCYWGLALALGNKMNAPMTGHEYSDAQAAIQKALTLKANVTPVEYEYIRALHLRFQHPPKLVERVGAFSCHKPTGKQDESTAKELIDYSFAMKKLVEKFADDNDAKAIYAYALINRINWKTWDLNAKMNPITPTITKTLQAIFAKDQMHIGGNHYYIHAIEPSPSPEDALDSANRLRKLVPGSEHLVHMPSHIYFLTGSYHEATNANLRAIKTFQRYIEACRQQGFEPEIYYLYFHNYDFLRSAATMEGRKALALNAAKQIIQHPFPAWLKNEPALQWFIPIPLFVKARFGMWTELLNEPKPDSIYTYALGMWHYAHALALAHVNDVKETETDLAELQKIISLGETDANLGKAGVSLLKIANEILIATIADIQLDERSALFHLKRAAKIQYDMGYHEPPDWYFPVKEALGNAYLKWNHPRQAIRTYNQTLQQYPKNPWTLYGLAAAHRKLDQDDEANKAQEEFKQAWQYADIPTPVNMFE